MRFPSAAGVLAACGVLLAAPIPKETGKPVKDEEAILGTWRIEGFEGADGPPADEVAKVRLVFADGKVTTLKAGVREGDPLPYRLDPAARPKAIDLTEATGVMPGVYDLDGDTLRLCVADGPKAARPAELKAVGKGVVLLTLKRETDGIGKKGK